MRIRTLLSILALAGLGVTAAAWVLRAGGDAAPAPVAVAESFAALEQHASDFPAPGDAPLAFPADHAAKPGQFVESWLFAGVLRDELGARWGFQLALQRVALTQTAGQRDSAWAARDLWRARLAIEPDGAAAVAAERVSRAALGLAGASDAPLAAWVEDWRFELDPDGDGFRLQGAVADDRLDLRVALSDEPPIAIERAPFRGYWWPGLEVNGTLAWQGRPRAVAGRAMLDRLWGRALPAGRGQLALASLWVELADGTAARCEQLRRRAGGGAPLTECVTTGAAAPSVELTPLESGWRTVEGMRLPLQWALQPGDGEVSISVAAMSSAGMLSRDGSWHGVVVPQDGTPGWGLLQLGNFPARDDRAQGR